MSLKAQKAKVKDESKKKGVCLFKTLSIRSTNLVCILDHPIGVRENGELQTIASGEGSVRLDRISRDANDLGALTDEDLVLVAEGANLLSAFGGAVLGVKEQNHGGLADELGEVNRLAVLVQQGEVGGGLLTDERVIGHDLNLLRAVEGVEEVFIF